MKIITIGRSPENQVIIEDEMISKFHLKIWQNENSQILLQDLDSTNGTYLNGQKIKNEQRIVNLGDKIKIGKTELDWEKYFEEPQIKEKSEVIDNQIVTNDEDQNPLSSISTQQKFDEANNRVLLYGCIAIALLLTGFILTWYFNFVVRP